MSSIASSPTLHHDRCHHTIFRPIPVPTYWRQWIYLFVIQGVFAGFIDGGANFGIAYAMYHGQKSVKMWVFKESTIAGDLGVTPIIQCAVSMIITSTLVHTDLHHHAIKPLPFVYPHVDHLPDPRIFVNKLFRIKEKLPNDDSDNAATAIETEKGVQPFRRGGLKYYYFMLIRFIFEGSEKNMLAERVGPRRWFGRLLWTGLQGAALGIVFGFPLWCLAIVILGPIYKNDNMGNKWAPQIIKCVYGAIVGWITNPVIAGLALGSQADHNLVVVPVDGESIIGLEDGQPAIATIPEDAELDTSAVVVPGFKPSTGPPSPFLRPFRANTTGQYNFDGTTTAAAMSTPGRTRSRSPSDALRLQATRSRSASVSRPPLVASVSYMAELPAPVAGTPVRPTRPRGLTVSSYMSSTTGSTFTYALGGTGGRARRPGNRPRANTTSGYSDTDGRPRPAFLGGSAQGSSHPSPSGPGRAHLTPSPVSGRMPSVPAAWSRQRTRSDVAGGSARCEKGAEKGATALARESGEEQFDVFGRTEVPTLTLQRPSVEMSPEERLQTLNSRPSTEFTPSARISEKPDDRHD